MKYKDILDKLGPCGLSCEQCAACTDGKIKHHSTELKKYLGNFDVYAKRFAVLLNMPIYDKYPDFKAFLDHLTSVECNGCRKENCKIFKGCKVKDCCIDKKVDFCFQCSEFPCDHTGFDKHLRLRWVNIQKQMKEIGVEAFYIETRDTPRY